jgi:hypothetical protein
MYGGACHADQQPGKCGSQQYFDQSVDTHFKLLRNLLQPIRGENYDLSPIFYNA